MKNKSNSKKKTRAWGFRRYEFQFSNYNVLGRSDPQLTLNICPEINFRFKSYFHPALGCRRLQEKAKMSATKHINSFHRHELYNKSCNCFKMRTQTYNILYAG